MKSFFSALSILCLLNLGLVQVFADGDEFTNFTDINQDQLIDITSQYASNELLFGIDRRLVIDQASSYETQTVFDVAGSHTIGFTGSYYDNTITGLSACNSSTYHFSTNNQTVDSVLVVEPAIYGSLNHSSHNMVLNFGIDVNSAYSGSVSTSTSAFDNTTQACSLIGMNEGDGAIDGTTLLQAGYEKKTITYNDGSTYGHAATFYVPGSESINFSTDDLQGLIDAIFTHVINGLTIDYHYQYDFYLTGSPNIAHAMPEYGILESRVYLPLMFGYTSWLTDEDPTKWLTDYTVYPDQTTSDHTYFTYRPNFNLSLTDDVYTGNYSRFYWSGTDNPHWYFRSKQFRDVSQLTSGQQGASVERPVIGDGSTYNSLNAGWNFGTQYFGLGEQLYTVRSSDIETHPNLTTGAKLPVGIGFYNIKYYKVQDTSRLNLFNQLGSFLNDKFNQLKNAITGINPSGSTDITNDIENNYNIDTDIEINNYLDNLVDRDEDIDLTSPEFTLPDPSSLQLISDIPSRTISIFTDNNLGFMLLLPIIVAIIGLVL